MFFVQAVVTSKKRAIKAGKRDNECCFIKSEFEVFRTANLRSLLRSSMAKLTEMPIAWIQTAFFTDRLLSAELRYINSICIKYRSKKQK